MKKDEDVFFMKTVEIEKGEGGCQVVAKNEEGESLILCQGETPEYAQNFIDVLRQINEKLNPTTTQIRINHESSKENNEL